MINYSELENLVKSNESLEKIMDCSYEDLIGLFGKNFADMKGFNQNNPHHCYDLLEHTVKTVENIHHISDYDLLHLKIAALFHDIGKPEVAFEKNGKTVFYGHAKMSAEIAKPLLTEIKIPSEQIKRIIFFIEQHDAFISFKPKDVIVNSDNPYIKEINAYNVKEKINKIREYSDKYGKYVPDYNDFYVLLYLCFADALSQSDIVVQNGRISDSKKQKIERLTLIQNIIKALI